MRPSATLAPCAPVPPSHRTAAVQFLSCCSLAVKYSRSTFRLLSSAALMIAAASSLALATPAFASACRCASCSVSDEERRKGACRPPCPPAGPATPGEMGWIGLDWQPE